MRWRIELQRRGTYLQLIFVLHVILHDYHRGQHLPWHARVHARVHPVHVHERGCATHGYVRAHLFDDRTKLFLLIVYEYLHQEVVKANPMF